MRALLSADAHRAAISTTNRVLLAVATALGALSTVLIIALADEDGAALRSDAALQEAMHGASVGGLLVVVAGCIGIAGDWRHGQATTTFLTEPRRGRVVAARAAVHAAVGLVFGLAASAGALAAAAVTYRAEGQALPLDRAAVWSTLAGVTASVVLLGVLGAALGAVARNATVGVVATLAWFYIVEPTVLGASATVGRWLPGMAATGLGRAPNDDLLTPGPAATVLAASCVVALAVGSRLVERSDITT